MSGIPRAALVLGLAGLLPFLWGVVTMYVPAGAALTQDVIGPRFIGPYLQLAYGAVILSFMSGVLWGFAARADEKAAVGYGLSVIPALWAFFMVGGGPVAAAMNLIVGFVGLLILDWQFSAWGLAPKWWMKLRIMLTAVVIFTLIPVVI